MPGHVPTVAQLRPGVVTVHTEMDKDIQKFFVSSGFAFVHADSTADVVAVEAVKLDDLDTEAVRAGLQVRLASMSTGHIGVHVIASKTGPRTYNLGRSDKLARPSLQRVGDREWRGSRLRNYESTTERLADQCAARDWIEVVAANHCLSDQGST
jgi:hypothetical protein